MGRSLFTMSPEHDEQQRQINEKLTAASEHLEQATCLAIDACAVALQHRYFAYAKTLLDLAETVQSAKGSSIARKLEPKYKPHLI